jgi:hypothetical protein
MLPLASKTSPTLRGASSLENCEMDCSAFSSKSLKCSFSKPVHEAFIGSVTVTLIRTSCVSDTDAGLATSGRIVRLFRAAGLAARC